MSSSARHTAELAQACRNVVQGAVESLPCVSEMTTQDASSAPLSYHRANADLSSVRKRYNVAVRHVRYLLHLHVVYSKAAQYTVQLVAS